jgi:hypothetical protein
MQLKLVCAALADLRRYPDTIKRLNLQLDWRP